MTALWSVIYSMKGTTASRRRGVFMHCVLLLTLLGNISAELFHLHRDPSVGNIKPEINHNIITTYDECKKYLCKYGYLKLNCNCHEEALREKRSIPEQFLAPVELGAPAADRNSDSERTDNSGDSGADAIVSDVTVTPDQVCTEQHFAEALRLFQKNYKLEQTGTCDQVTASKMSKRRCGQPDTVIDKLPGETESTEDTPSAMRRARSLRELLNKNTERDRAIEARKKQLQQYLEELKSDILQPKYKSDNPRGKRSVLNVTVSEDYGGPLAKTKVSWRLMIEHYSPMFTAQTQRGILRQAFRYWSEVSPLCFEENNVKPDVDIQIGFLEGAHLSCFRQFDGYGGEIAHKFYRDVHFDKSEPYSTETAPQSNSYINHISLLLVATHELGHVIGLNHSSHSDSVMNAIYHQSIKGDFELSSHDRLEVKKAYGPCTGRFSVVFDYVRYFSGGRRYNTYFIRSDHYWMYENVPKRARYGDPLPLTGGWSGVPNDVNAFVHYFELRRRGHGYSVYDEYIFFKGNMYYSYDSTTDKVIESNLTSSKFKSSNGSIPNGLDTAFYDHRDKYIYFFKGEYVYVYDYKPNAPHSCCVRIQKIRDEFPPMSQSNLTSVSGETYTNSLDVVFYSYYHSTLYFVKGNDVWENTLYSISGTPRQNSMKYKGLWSDTWHFLCDGECS